MLNRFFLDAPLDGTVTLTGDEAHHGRVVRLREGEEIELFDGRGAAAVARVESIARDAVTATVVGPAPSREAAASIHLAMAIIQLEKFELVLQKATELGVRSIVPVVSERVEVRPERYRGKQERWERIVFEAVKQSGRSVVPKVAPATPLAALLARAGEKVMFDAGAEPGVAQARETTLIVGPEGGWSDAELAAARRAECVFQRLGARRLRAETAALAAVVTAVARAGEL